MNVISQYYIFIILAVLLLCSSINLNASQKHDVPETIIIDQQLINPQNSWQHTVRKEAHILQSLEVFDRHPKEKASLIPDETKTNEKGQMVNVWQLAGNKKDRYWISCSYTHTGNQYIRPLPSNAVSCAVTYDTQVSVNGMLSIISIEFK
jgi:hypothetical protein